MMPDPHPATFVEIRPTVNTGTDSRLTARMFIATPKPKSRSFRWYLLASFVTGLLLGAAVARVVGL